MQYQVRALSRDQRVSQLTIEAHDESDARRQIEARGLFVATIAPDSGFLFRLGTPRASGPKLSLVLFSQELLALLNAGLNIVEALEALLEKEGNASNRSVFERLLAGLREGRRFSQVLAEQPKLFPPLYIGIVGAAEGTSNLPRSLARFIEYRQRIDKVRNKIISASIYPLILICVGGAVSLFLIGYVVPRFASVYQSAGRSLPWLSQLLLHWGEFAAAHTTALLCGTVAGLSYVVIALRKLLTEGGPAQLLAKLPGVQHRVRIYELSRLYLTLGMLIEGGIPIVPAMDSLPGIVSSDLKQRLLCARDRIQQGISVSSAFESNQLTTPISLRMLRVGERSGELGQMLTQSASFYDEEIGRWIDRFTRMFEPLLMAAIGIVVGAIVVLLYMPIFDLAGNFS